MKKIIAIVLLGISSFGWSDTKISNLPVATTMDDTDILPIVTGVPSAPSNKRITKGNMLSTINSSTLNVSGSSTLSSLTVPSAINAYGLVVTPGVGSLGYVSIGSNGAGNIVINTPLTVSGGYSLYLPATQGASNTFLKNDGSGNLSWSATTGIGDAVLATTQTWSGGNTFLSTTTMGVAGVNGPTNSPYLAIYSTGTSYGLLVDQTGRAGGALQNKLGAVTIRNRVPNGFAAPLLVLVDSSTDVQAGAGVMEIYVESLTRNDPGIWYHDTSNGSGGQIRIDATGTNGPNFEVTGSSNLTQGLSKWEPFAVPGSGGTVLQTGSSRCWDNSGFDNQVYWEPLSKGGGMFIQAADSTGCEAGSGYFASSQTVAINWYTLNGHTVGLRGPSNTTNSWTFQLPSTISNGGQVMYQATSGSPRNWEFTTGGTAGQSLKFTSTSAAPVWGTSEISSLTVAQIGATVPTRVGQMYYCSNCTALRVCVSTGTTVGSFSSPVSATTGCN